LLFEYEQDMGGIDEMSFAQRVLCKRAVSLTCQSEMIEARWAVTDGVASAKDLDLYQRLVNTLRRTLSELGIKPKRKELDITPLAYMQRKAREKEEALA
jgi:predicted signal transduction protein with EAL and GGDEF domain